MTSDRQTRITISGLSPDEVNLIKDAARFTRKTIKALVLDHATDVMAYARISDCAPKPKGD